MDYAKVSNCILVEISIVFFLLIKNIKAQMSLFCLWLILIQVN